MIREIVAVGIGGALGSMSRYLVSYVWLVEQSLLGFPAGTFTVNAAGSLLMGFLLEILGAGTASWLLSVGFCGGFTTFSTFSSDVVRMLKSGDYTAAGLCVALNFAVCVCRDPPGHRIGTVAETLTTNKETTK